MPLKDRLKCAEHILEKEGPINETEVIELAEILRVSAHVAYGMLAAARNLITEHNVI